MPCGCKIITVFKSGSIRKSPPIEKLVRGYKCLQRHCTLGINELCKNCCQDGKAESKKLVFSYFKDDSENELKSKY